MWPEIVHANFCFLIYEIWLRRLMLRYYSLNTKVCVCPQPGSLLYDVTTPHWNQCAAFNFVCWSSSVLREKSNILRHFLKLFVSVMSCFLVKRLFRQGKEDLNKGRLSQDGIQEDIKIRRPEGDALENNYVCCWYAADRLPCLTPKTLQIVFSSRL